MPVTFVALCRFNLLARDERGFAVHGCLWRLGCRRATLRHRVTSRKGFVQRVVALVGVTVSFGHDAHLLLSTIQTHGLSRCSYLRPPAHRTDPAAPKISKRVQCPVCGGDMRDLVQVLEHHGPLPHRPGYAAIDERWVGPARPVRTANEALLLSAILRPWGGHLPPCRLRAARHRRTTISPPGSPP